MRQIFFDPALSLGWQDSEGRSPEGCSGKANKKHVRPVAAIRQGNFESIWWRLLF
jgi:hypothetical protein